MATDLISYLVSEQVAEREARYVADLQQTLEVTLATRFPQAPLELVLRIRAVTKPEMLHQLIRTAVQVSDLSAFETALTN